MIGFYSVEEIVTEKTRSLSKMLLSLGVSKKNRRDKLN